MKAVATRGCIIKFSTGELMMPCGISSQRHEGMDLSIVGVEMKMKEPKPKRLYGLLSSGLT
jgi:hypothetical protein